MSIHVNMINIYSLEPSDIVKENILETADDTTVDADEDVVIAGLEDDLAKEESELMSLREVHLKSLESNFPSKEMKDLAVSKVKTDQTNKNRTISRKLLCASGPIKKKNAKLLDTLEMIIVMIKRNLKAIPTTTKKKILDQVKMENIPSYTTMKERQAFIREVFFCVVDGKSAIMEPVFDKKDLGRSLSKIFGICQKTNFSLRQEKGMESYSGSPLFNIKNYPTVSTTLGAAGYETQDFFLFIQTLETIATNLRSSDLIFDNYTPLNESEVEDLMIHHDYTDTVDMVDASQARRLRFSALQNLRSQILIDALVQDSSTILRMVQKLASHISTEKMIHLSQQTNEHLRASA